MMLLFGVHYYKKTYGYRLLAQLGDFGLAAYIKSGKGSSSATLGEDDCELWHGSRRTDDLPVRWTAPEALMYKSLSPEADVWSYGIFLMELLADGTTPYQELANNEVLDQVSANYGPCVLCKFKNGLAKICDPRVLLP